MQGWGRYPWWAHCHHGGGQATLFRILSLPQKQVGLKSLANSHFQIYWSSHKSFRYGVGYHLTITKDGSRDAGRVEQLVKSFVPEAEQATDVGAELSFILPASSTPSFPVLFGRLDMDKVPLGIKGFGVSVTTMEEVFIKVGEDQNKLWQKIFVTS